MSASDGPMQRAVLPTRAADPLSGSATARKVVARLPSFESLLGATAPPAPGAPPQQTATLDDAADEFLRRAGTAPAPVLPEGVAGLRALSRLRSWDAIVSRTAGPATDAAACALWRAVALHHLRRPSDDILKGQLKALAPALDYTKTPPNAVTVSLRIAAAHFAADADARLALLQQLLKDVGSGPLARWVRLALADEHCASGRWRLAVADLSAARLAVVRDAVKPHLRGTANHGHGCASAGHLDSMLGRIFSQVSMLAEARDSFKRSELWLRVAVSDFDACDDRSEAAEHARAKAMALPHMHAALVAFARDDYANAALGFKAAALHEESFFDAPGGGDDLAGLFRAPSAATNGAAICALYVCDLESAISLLEALVRRNAALHLTDIVAFNICTLYDLASSNSCAARRKRVLQHVAARSGLGDVDAASFRIAA
ncbi:hypothetical protein M885DRAFT_130612 [Pelagophyceae sp. CCMP2097]|nr:hypothetical protein M885DRAFT_130612 [Pelagophyceae sp. CCMP2097]